MTNHRAPHRAAAPNGARLTGATSRQPIAGTPTTLEDLAAILSAQQDQIDDLTAVVEDLVRRTAAADPSEPAAVRNNRR